MRRVVGVVLAAGRSERFGTGNKLLADLNGRPLAAHAAAAMAALDLAARGVVCRGDVATLFDGYRVLSAPAGSGQALSLQAAVWFAREEGATDLLIALADMPFITTGDMQAVLARGAGGLAAATDGTRRLPPVCLPGSAFGGLDALSGDEGARGLLRGLDPGQLVTVPARRLRDVNTVAELDAVRGGQGG